MVVATPRCTAEIDYPLTLERSTHCFWQASDSVCTTVFSVTLSQKETASFNLWRQPRDFENATLVAHWREHFRSFWSVFIVSVFSPKRGVLIHKNVKNEFVPIPTKKMIWKQATNKQT